MDDLQSIIKRPSQETILNAMNTIPGELYHVDLNFKNPFNNELGALNLIEVDNINFFIEAFNETIFSNIYLKYGYPEVFDNEFFKENLLSPILKKGYLLNSGTIRTKYTYTNKAQTFYRIDFSQRQMSLNLDHPKSYALMLDWFQRLR